MEKPIPAYTGNEPYVFVCYAHDDSDIIYPEMEWLHTQGVNLWYDEGISAGKNWRGAIGESLLGAGHVLFYISKNSLQSDHCNREINLALDECKEVVPIYLEEVELTPDLKVGLNRVHALHRGQDASYKQHLLNALGQVTPTVESHGIRKTEDTAHRGSFAIGKGSYFVAALLLLAIGFMAVQQFGSFDGQESATVLEDMTIAVLPLDNLSPDPDNAYFAAGVHEEILNQLAKISAIQVTSRRAVLRYQDTTESPADTARELNVSYVMEGSVRFDGNSVAITTQLIRATDGFHLWSETYLRELDDIFAIQADVAKQIASAMQATLLPAEIASIERPATVSTEAYTLFLQHRYQWEQERGRSTLDEDGWVETGIRQMEQAVELDPLFAKGFAELGFLKRIKGGIGPGSERNELVDEGLFYANKAIEIDPTIARGYVVLSQVSFERRQWDEWENYARKSVELPDLDGRAAFGFALRLSEIGRYEESYHWSNVATSKDPSLALYRENAVVVRIDGGDYESALMMADQFRAVGGDENAYHSIRAYILNRLNRKPESLDEFSKIAGEPTDVTLRAISAYHSYLRCQLGEQDNVMDELDELGERRAFKERVFCAAGVGDVDKIFEIFQQQMSTGRNIFPATYDFDIIKSDPRWQEVEEYMNIPDLN